MARVNAKFMSGLSPVMPVEEAARVVVGTRLNAVVKLLPRTLKAKPGSGDGERAIHALRVCTRRASAALMVFRPLIGRKELRIARKRLRAIRKAAGPARDCDVQIGILNRAGASARQSHQRAAIKHLTAQTRALRRAAQEPLARALDERPVPKLRKAFDRVVESVDSDRTQDKAFGAEARMVDAARVVIERGIARVREAAGAGDDLRDLDRVHELRIELKRLRYAMEVFVSCFGREFRVRLYPELVALQECLGTVHDAHVLIGRIGGELAAKSGVPSAEVRRGLRVLLAEQRETLASAHGAFLEAWKRFASGRFFEALRHELHAGIGGRDLRRAIIAPRVQRSGPVAGVQVEAKPALDGMVRHRERGEGRPDGMKSVRRLARECGYEAAHARQVTRLALRVFDQMAEQKARVKAEPGMRFDDEARMLLESAGLLHDIGYLINYAQHHKHSYHLIVHADLAGLTTRQVQVIANVARYHRSAEPKPRHRSFAMLSPEDRALVSGLAAILRIADGLDRTHMQNVREVSVKLEKGEAHFAVRATEEPAVDIWGAVRKSGLYRACFGLMPHFAWRRSSEDGQSRASAGRMREPVGTP